MKNHWNFYTAGQLAFGFGAVASIADFVQRRRLTRALLVTDRLLVRAGVVTPIEAVLSEACVTVETFDGSEEGPSIAVVLEAIDTARQFDPPVNNGVGGGSNMDLAKIVAISVTHGGSPHDYFGFDNVPGPVLPLICVTTTAGTGSEVSHAAVLTDTEHAMKVSTLSNYLRPQLAVVDPELTMSCPRQVTADSGIDALTHAIEAYTATDFDKLAAPPGAETGYEGRFPLADCLAEKAIRLIGQHLVTAVHEPTNRTAREGMSLAATLAGIAFSNAGVAIVHALEYPLGGMLHCPHGAGNGLLPPYAMRFNQPARRETFARIATLLGRDVAGQSLDEAAAQAISAVEDLRREIGIPDRIRELGGTVEQLPEFARKAFSLQRLMWVNPRQPTEEELLNIYREAF